MVLDFSYNHSILCFNEHVTVTAMMRICMNFELNIISFMTIVNNKCKQGPVL